jgi:hypothetical protein
MRPPLSARLPFAVSEYIVDCATRDSLIDLLANATKHYLRVVEDLIVVMGTTQEPVYALAKSSVDMAREIAEDARRALLDHRQEHGC